MRRGTTIVALAIAVTCTAAEADTIVLKSGESFSGTITQITPDSIDVTTSFAGLIHVKPDMVKSLRSDAKVTIVSGETAHAAFVAPVAEPAAGTKGWHEVEAAAPAVAAAPATAPAVVPEKLYTVDLEKYFLPVGPHWKDELTLGVVNTTGNTSQSSFSGALDLNYKDTPNELALKLGGIYETTEGKQTAGQAYFDAVYRRTLVEWDKTERWYAYAENHELYDAVKAISYRITNSFGLGYYLIKNDKVTLDLRAGPAYVCQKFFSGDSESDISGLAGLRITYTVDDRTSNTEDALYTTSLQDGRIYQLTSETAVKYKLPEIAHDLGLKLAFRDDYDNATSGNTKNNDTRFTLALTFDF